MNEQKTERVYLTADEYLQRVRSLLSDIDGWCEKNDLSVEHGVITLKQHKMDDYVAPTLYISKDGESLARVEPIGARILCADGRVDLIGRLAGRAQHLLFRIGKGPAAVKATRSLPASLSAVEKDGWYWVEAHIRRPKPIDEDLFLDLLTDVSDYEFH